MLRNIAWLLLLMVSLTAACKDVRTKQMENIDWKSLEFVCKTEQHTKYKDTDEAEQWYRTANRYYKVGSDKDLIESVKYLQKAADQGHVKAMNNLVLAYLNGDGIEQSDKMAVRWAEQMIKAESGSGYYHMGTFLEQGTGVKQDRKAALSYFRKAADLGNDQGQLAVGEKMLSAFYPPEVSKADKDKGYAIATSMLQCALNQGLGEAGYKLGLHYSGESMTNQSMLAMQAAGKLGHLNSLYWLHSGFRDGPESTTKDGLIKDTQRAACYYKLVNEIREDKTKRFPNLDKICPLPPKPMP
jgi:uncharacterized protein